MATIARHTGCPGPEACDLARQHVALSEADQAAYLTELEADRDTYRELLQHALAGWHAALDERDRARAECARLREQYRALRAAVMQADAQRAA